MEGTERGHGRVGEGRRVAEGPEKVAEGSEGAGRVPAGAGLLGAGSAQTIPNRLVHEAASA